MSNDNSKLSLVKSISMTMRAIRMWLKQYPPIFISTGVYAIFNALSPLVNIYFTAQIINELIGQRDNHRLTMLVIITLSVNAFMLLVKYAMERWKNASCGCLWYRNSKFYSDKLLNMDFRSVDDAHSYDLMSQAEQNTTWGGWGFIQVINSFELILTALVQIIGSVSLTVSLFLLNVPDSIESLVFLNSPLCIAGILVIMAVVTFLSPYFDIKSQGYWIRCSDAVRIANRVFSFYGFLGNTTKYALDVRMYRQEKLCRKYFSDNNNAFGYKGVMAKYTKGSAGLLSALSASISYVFTAVIYLYVCLKAWGGAFEAGSITQYICAITTLASGVSQLIFNIGNMKNNCEFLKTNYEFLDIPNDMYQGSLSVEKRSDRNYQIEFKNVSFKYPGSNTWALKNLSLKFNIGQKLAVVGQNGSGKTTFIKLLCRLYDPDEGVITLNGIDIRKYNYLEYMSVYSVVFQDFSLFALPLGQNVAAGNRYDKERVEKCLKETGYEDKLNTMPDGVESYLYKDFNKNGVNVSGGEAQKIAIARALYKDSPYIILDEPTAALDPISEAEIYTKFNDLIQDKTAIYISHRLSSCKFCDEVAVFDNGQVVQHGTHDELVEDTDGKYYELWNAQAQYYTDKQTAAI